MFASKRCSRWVRNARSDDCLECPDVSADGRFLINVANEDRFSSPITVILNWADGVKKK